MFFSTLDLFSAAQWSDYASTDDRSKLGNLSMDRSPFWDDEVLKNDMLLSTATAMLVNACLMGKHNETNIWFGFYNYSKFRNDTPSIYCEELWQPPRVILSPYY
jgi:hypothetical protein